MEAETTQRSDALLPLDEPRVLAIQDGKFTYTFHFARILPADWSRYFERIVVKSRNEGTKQVNTMDMEAAGLDLFERALIKVEGYRGDFASRAGWQEKIPPRHSQQVAWLLRMVAPSQEAEEACDPEQIEVRLDALWSQTTPGAETVLFKGLVHRFGPPSAEQKRRYYNAGSQSVVVGGSRNGTTIYGKRHRVLLDIYDELVLDVDGYSIGNRELHDPAEVRREMDSYHKFIAAQQIFVPLQPATEAAEEAQAA
jgi:hypothetical protein